MPKDIWIGVQLSNMKPIIIFNDKILDAVSWFFRVGGIAIFPFIILRESRKKDKFLYVLINHETIHFKQALELLVIPFYILYLLFWAFNLFKYGFNAKEAYRNIPFEKEANAKELDRYYLETRKLYSWIKYF